MQNKVVIFTAPVKTGKTAVLMEWARGKANLGGILAPDLDGRRHLLKLRDRSLQAFQLSEEAFANAPAEEVVSICKFNFRAATFADARKTLLEDSQGKFDWVVIDEIGKLELKGEGLEPAVSAVVDWYHSGHGHGRLMLVVREEKLPQVLEYFDITDYDTVRMGSPMPH